jgi:hypothetical protein
MVVRLWRVDCSRLHPTYEGSEVVVLTLPARNVIDDMNLG